MKMIRLIGLACFLWLAACATPRAAGSKGFTAAQAGTLRAAGFELTPRGYELGIGDRLLFAPNEAQVKAGQLTRLTRLAMALRDVGISKLRVEGHADATGTARYNRELSAHRASAVREALAIGGIARQGLEAEGLGSADPIESNRTRAGRAQNRRVVIIVPPQA